MGNLAQELDLELQEAASLWREVQGCCSATATASALMSGNSSGDTGRPSASSANGLLMVFSTVRRHCYSTKVLQTKGGL
jgi:hypothetical protein